jgi:hypothetical protein
LRPNSLEPAKSNGLLIGHLYGISSERKLVEELRMYLVWR